ncbi:MAG: hypothetical protein IAE89_12610 [Anaerolineae bacterium]|nr:hypothetical protein [Anaerolineae bacterium]
MIVRLLKKRLLSPTVLLALLLSALLTAAPAQLSSAQSEELALQIFPGFDGYFREYEWLPVQVQVTNNGDDLVGRLVVRPETSGDGIPNAYSVPVTLPAGARQTIPLLITARSYATQARVELIDDDGVVLAAQSRPIRALQANDRLYVVLNETPSGTLDMTGARFGGGAVQAIWTLDDLPSSAAALQAVDVMLFTDIDTASLSAGQFTALRDWVTAGGHLMVTGGVNWQATGQSLLELLPMIPEASETVTSLAPLGEWLRVADTDALIDENGIVVTTGALAPDARVLLALDDGTPLIVRGELGAGTVDYFTVDPNAEPLRSWDHSAELWYTLQSTRAPAPGWSHGFGNWDQAVRAAEILPGVDALPDMLPVIAFLSLYITLIGPLNYVILKRINRLEWAWGTIPLCIVLFTVLAWSLGYSLRGDTAILNRMAVVQTWVDSDRASVDGIVGVFSPRRLQYTLSTEGDDVLRPVPPVTGTSGLLARGAATSININEGSTFTAEDFAIDASFVSTFTQQGMIDRPQISGSVSITPDEAIPGQMHVRGSVTNNTDFTLRDPVILGRGIGLHLGEDLAPGAISTFDLVLSGEGAAAPSPYVPTNASPYLGFRMAQLAARTETSVMQIIGTERYDTDPMLFALNISSADQELWRQQLLLWSLVDDSYGSTGRGDSIFLAGWADTAPLEVALEGAGWSDQRTTLFLVELETDLQQPDDHVLITGDRMMWSVRDYDGFGALSPVDLNMQPGETVSFRFTPLPDAVLGEVDALSLRLSEMNISSRRVPLYLWDWQAETWEAIEVNREGLTISDPERYLGPENAVQVRLIADEIGGYLRIGRLDIEQSGRF